MTEGSTPPPSDEDVFQFVQSAIPSVWALELLQLVQRSDRLWRPAELVAELRSSPSAVALALQALSTAGLLAAEDGAYRFHPASEAVAALVARTLAIYAVRPAWVIRAVMSAPNDKLRIFANSFRLKD